MASSPPYMEAVAKNDPELKRRAEDLINFARADGALSAKVKTLMMLVVDIYLGREGGIKSLSAQARSQGASEAEICETVRLACLMGGLPCLVAGTAAYKA